ncbi:MAG TPA: DUF6526 family protein [Ignavibacteria bacterium]|nr:DUF6526 family protein [Ignavibacteria bacterium]
MKEQNYSNHKKYVAGYHFISFGVIFILLILSVISVYQALTGKTEILYPVMFLLISVSFLFLFLYARAFALKAQDRAIRAEESLRHFIMTGKPFDPKITIAQILALRFSPDAEFAELVQKAVSENLGPDEIKKAIKNWKADNYRV